MAKILHTLKYQKFREILISARLNAGLTQLDVATKLEKPQSFVSKYEAGERRLDVIEFIQICVSIGVSPQEIFRKIEDLFN